MLTPQQAACLAFIQRYQADNMGASPSFEEIKAAIGLKSRSGVHRHLHDLERRGFIHCTPYLKRSIEILRLPDDPRDEVIAAARRLLDATTPQEGNFLVPFDVVTSLRIALAEVR